MVGRLALLVLLAMPSKEVEVEIVTINRPKEIEREEATPFE